MVLPVLAALAGVFKVNYSRTLVDSRVFRLHYQWTTSFCFICSALVTASDYVGDAIQCLQDYEEAPKPITTYCWISSTYTINSTGPVSGLGLYRPKIHEQHFHSYYQWVPAVLFLQGCLFYLPHFIWKFGEKKQVDKLLQDLNKGIFDNDAKKKIENIVQYLKDTRGLNIQYALGYFLCESLNLINVLGQMFLMNAFLGGLFMTYGIKVFKFLASNDATRNDALMETFPRVTQCNFHMFGSGGEIQKKNVLCVLPQNIINEKIYLVMWLWFIILTVATILQLLWLLVVFYSPSLRIHRLQHHTKTTLIPAIEGAVRRMQLGDYCLLESIGCNLNHLRFRELLQGVAKLDRGVHAPTAPQLVGTYRPLYRLSESDNTLPRKRFPQVADTSF
ncbi:innexin inx3-like [Panulirus ornatus]|uniref:innexin inx3-like n=1 Tax=Panulirus ornatus TaxID=150431 RepID=UPI003A878B0B